MVNTFQANRIVKCYKSNDLSKPFVRKISDVIDNNAIVDILDYDPSDRYAAYKVNYTVRVKICDIVPLEVKRHTQ